MKLSKFYVKPGGKNPWLLFIIRFFGKESFSLPAGFDTNNWLLLALLWLLKQDRFCLFPTLECTLTTFFLIDFGYFPFYNGMFVFIERIYWEKSPTNLLVHRFLGREYMFNCETDSMIPQLFFKKSIISLDSMDIMANFEIFAFLCMWYSVTKPKPSTQTDRNYHCSHSWCQILHIWLLARSFELEIVSQHLDIPFKKLVSPSIIDMHFETLLPVIKIIIMIINMFGTQINRTNECTPSMLTADHPTVLINAGFEMMVHNFGHPLNLSLSLSISLANSWTPSSSCASTTLTKSCSSSSTTPCSSWSRRSTSARALSGRSSTLDWTCSLPLTLLRRWATIPWLHALVLILDSRDMIKSSGANLNILIWFVATGLSSPGGRRVLVP